MRRSTTSGSFSQKRPWWTSTSCAPALGRALEQLARGRDAARDLRHVVGADDLQAQRPVVRNELDVEQLVGERDDLVPRSHGRSSLSPVEGPAGPGAAEGRFTRPKGQPRLARRLRRRSPWGKHGFPHVRRRGPVGNHGFPHPDGVPRFELGASPGPERSALPGCATPRGSEADRTRARILAPVLKAVLLDVDFTLFRPGPELGPEGYHRIGARHGLEPRARAVRRCATGRRSRTSSETPTSSTTRSFGSRSRRRS